MRNAFKLIGFAVLAAASLSCGDVARASRSPVYLTLDSLTAATGGGATTFGNVLFSDVLRLAITPAPCSPVSPCPTIFADLGQATLRIVAKDVTGLAPTTNNEVTITRYHVTFRRTDGRNTQGVDVPYAFDGAVTALVGTTASVIGFELVKHVAKDESPLVQLINSRTIITTFAEVIFYGTDRTGNAVSVSGTIQVEFGNFGDS